MPGVAAEKASPCWAGVVVYDTIFLSVHLLDHCIEGGRGDSTVTEVIDFVRCMQVGFKKLDLKIVLGIDGNCTLLPNVEGYTVGSVGQPAKSHTSGMRNLVMSLFGALEIRALNTFESGSTADATWSCGVKRPLQKRTQIDYIGCSALVEGEAAPYSILNRCFLWSDHRPVISSLRILCR